MIALLAAAIPLAFYLALPSTLWNFDGVACAAALELGNPVYFFHAQHLLYGFLGFLVWKALLPLGLMKALPALQIFNSLLAAAALYFLWRLLKTLSGDAVLALCVSTAAGLTAAFWVWSVEAQVYPLGVLGLAAASSLLLSAEAPLRMKRVGFWHAVAALGHIVHLLWVIPALYWIRREKLPLRPYLLTFLGTVSAAYGLVALFVLRPYHAQGAWLAHWWKGSLGLTADRSIAWHWPGASGFLQWVHATPGVLWGTYWPYNGVAVPTVIHIISATSQLMLMGLFCFCFCLCRHPGESRGPVHAVELDTGFRRYDGIKRLALIWLGIYALFFSTWEPETLCYRVTDMLPFSLLLLAGLLSLRARWVRLTLAGGWLISLALVNGWTRALPMHDSSRNHVYQQTVMLAKISPDTAFYLTNGGLTWIYLLYFTGRSAWNAQTLPIDDFGRRWSALQPRPALYASSALLRDPQVAPWLERHHLKVLAELPWLEVS